MVVAIGTLVCLVAIATLACGPPDAPSGAPNVLLISVDTLTPEALRAYDASAPPHPVLDGFAAEASVFEHALAPSSWTLPSHASLLTGRYPRRHGATDPRARLAEGIPTLAGVLRRHGWRTVAFTDSGFVDRSYGFSRGFDRYDDWTRRPRVLERLSSDAVAERELPWNGAPEPAPRQKPFERARVFLQGRAGAEQPFFLFLHTFFVHDYYLPAERTPREKRLARTLGPCVVGNRSCSAAQWRLLEDRYQERLAKLDAALGVLLDTLRRAGLAERTLVVVVSDHGEGFEPERGRIHHGGRLHADQLRVPLLVRGPGVSAGRCATRASLVDLMPTLLGQLGLPLPAELDGVSLAPALRGECPRRHDVLHASDHAYRWLNGRRELAEALRDRPFLAAVVDDEHWYIEALDEGRQELYAQRDARQLEDLAPRARTVVSRLRGRLDEVGESALSGRREAQEIPPSLRQRLEALGYLEPEEP